MTATGRPFLCGAGQAPDPGFGSKQSGRIHRLGRAAHLYTARFGTLAAFACACTDEIPLELRQATEHGQHQPPV